MPSAAECRYFSVLSAMAGMPSAAECRYFQYCRLIRYAECRRLPVFFGIVGCVPTIGSVGMPSAADCRFNNSELRNHLVEPRQARKCACVAVVGEAVSGEIAAQGDLPFQAGLELLSELVAQPGDVAAVIFLANFTQRETDKRALASLDTSLNFGQDPSFDGIAHK
jgi:hypothetical protein